MARAGKKYGWAIACWELGNTASSLFRTISDYKDRLDLASTSLWRPMVDASWAPWPLRSLVMSKLSGRDNFGDTCNFCHYWSNFEIADFDFFRSKEYRTFFDVLDAPGGFYFERVSTVAPLLTMPNLACVGPGMTILNLPVGTCLGAFSGGCPLSTASSISSLR